MHLGPFHLFIILLLILMVASFARNWGLTEGFVAYQKDTPSFTKLIVSGYDKTNTIIRLYDDIYYDHRNGNAVLVTGAATTSALPTETTGTSLTAIDVYQRKGGASTRYTSGLTSQTTDESKISGIPNMETQWSVLSADKNQLNYMSWGTNTYLSVFDLTNAGLTRVDVSGSASVTPSYKITLASSYSGNVAGITKQYDINVPVVAEATYKYVDDATADKDYVEPIYDPSKNLYKFLNNVYYDVANGNLLMNTSTATATKSINVYYRAQTGLVTSGSIAALTGTAQSANAVTATQQIFSKDKSEPWFVNDSVNNNTIVYWPSGTNTILMAFANKNVAGKGVPILKVRRFTNNGIYSENTAVTASSGSTSANTDSSGNKIDDSLLDAFSRWYIYFNTSAVGSGNSSDYLLKTQIVPPVCPACPACPNGGGSCTNCGGQGGSGTLYGGGSLAVVNGSTIDVKGPSSGIASVGQSAGNVVNNTVNTAGNIVGKTLDTAGNIVGGTVGTAGNLLQSAGSGASNLLQATGSGVSNLLQATGSGVTNLLGVNNPNRFGYDQSYRGPNQSNVGSYGYVPQQNYMASSGTYNQGSAPGSNIDIYSQYGALPFKGSNNYRPITTDFSSFRK